MLAETDAINMVSRDIATTDILKGIHLSMASRIVKLRRVTGIDSGTALMTGGQMGFLREIASFLSSSRLVALQVLA
jgi:hypothetical protein